MTYDLIVIGGGPGGYVAAIRAAQLGKRVALIERERVGGTCLNHGCIPTKSLYHSAAVLRAAQGAGRFGVTCGEVGFDLDAVRAHMRGVVERLTGGVESLLKANGVTLLVGEASLLPGGGVQVNGQTLAADAILLATGSKPARLPVPGIELPGVMDSAEALRFDEIPERLVIIGGGVIGVEMAGVYRAFGAEVTIVEFLPSILANLDQKLARFAKKQLLASGVAVLTESRVTRIEGARGALAVVVAAKDGERTIPCTHVLSCAGRVPNTDGLGLDAAGVAHDRKGVGVDENYATSVRGVYAIGDVTGRVMLAHVASDEGRTFAERLCGMDAQVDYGLVPGCVFAFPELAWVGSTEAELKAGGVPYVSSRFQFAGNGKALSLGEGEGFVKMLASPDLSELLGVHIAGPHASDLIHEAAVMMRAMLTVEEAARTMHAHPTLAEALMECVQRFTGTAIHVPPKRRL